jgi:hypothetical protein
LQHYSFEDHNYEQKNGINSDQQSLLEVSYTHTDPLTKAETKTPNSNLKNNSARTRKTATTQDNAVNYTKLGNLYTTQHLVATIF